MTGLERPTSAMRNGFISLLAVLVRPKSAVCPYLIFKGHTRILREILLFLAALTPCVRCGPVLLVAEERGVGECLFSMIIFSHN